MKKRFLILLIVITGLQARSQWECPSKLAAHLDPIFNSPVLIGGEMQLSTGMLDGNSINTAMGFLGVDYSTKKHSLYLEGGVKAWWNYNFDEKQLLDQSRLGLRELFYQYRGQLSSITVGLQSATFDDHYLLNERIAGANYKLDLGKWKLNAYAGTVKKDFARNGIFCTTGFIYSLPTGQSEILLGNKPGDKNLSGFTLTFFPGREKKIKTKSDSDEFETFESDEFQETNEDEFQSVADDKFETVNEDEFETTEGDKFENFVDEKNVATKKNHAQIKREKNGQIGIENIGIAAYNEFGDWIPNQRVYTGLFASVKLPGDIYLNPEALIQIEKYNKGIIYLLELDKSFRFNNSHRLSLTGGFYGFSEIDEGAQVLNSYSNILAGEVLRLDAANMPLYVLGGKYNIPSLKFHIKLQNAGQLSGNDLNEWDIEIGKKFKNRLFVNAKTGVVKGGKLTEKVFLTRVEARFYF